MIYYFTALVISYSMGDQEASAVVWYDRERHCQEAMDDGLGDPLYTQLYELYGEDIMMSCHVSEDVSYVLRPRLRPKEESDG